MFDMHKCDRWIVSSWGRAGSVVLTHQVQFNMIREYPSEKCKWLKSQGIEYHTQLPPFSVTHSHSLEQLDYTQDCSVLIAIRNPSEAALSRSLSDSNNYYHKYSDEVIKRIYDRAANENYKDMWDDYQDAIIQYNNRLTSKLVNVDIAQLNQHREACIAWNETALIKAPTAIVINYADWNGDLVKSAKLIGIDYRAGFKSKLWTEMNPIPLIDRVANRNEIKAWLDAN